MQVLLLKLTESTCGCCETLFATVHSGFHAAQRGDRVSMVGSAHRPALSQSARLPASDLALERRAILWGLGPFLSPVVHNFFTTRKPQGWIFFFFQIHPKISLSNHAYELLARAAGKIAAQSCPETRLCHSIKIYLPSKHNDKLIQSRDLDTILAVPFQIPVPWYVILGGFT